MRPIRNTFTMAAASANAICLSQKPVAAGALTINGALASPEMNTAVWPSAARTVAVMDAYRHVAIASDADDSGRIFTITATDPNGTVFTETLAGPNATTTSSLNSVAKIISVAIDGAAAGNITVGTTNTAETPWYPIDRFENPTELGLQADFSTGASLTWQWQYSQSDPYDGSTQANKLATNTGSALTGDGVVNLSAVPVTMVRGKVTGYTSGSVAYSIIKSQ